MSTNHNKINGPKYTLCKEIGFDEKAMHNRIRKMDLKVGDKYVLQLLNQKVFEPQATDILDMFYEYVVEQPEMRPFINNQETLARLKKTQHEYLVRFGKHYDTLAYFEYRLRIGIAHARVSLPLDLYLSAYSKMQGLLQSAIFGSTLSEQAEMLGKCFNVVAKIILLDISLAIDAYNHMTMMSLNESVHQLEHTKHFLTNQLMHDSLTGILSRAYIMDVLQKKLALTSRDPESSFGIAMIDIDYFKHINDRHGHLIGDYILKQFCILMNSSVRAQDYFGRYGGEEFMLIVSNPNPEVTMKLVERMRKLIEEHVFKVDNKELQITISIGVAHADSKDDKVSLINRADNALYKAKTTGRNRICSE